MFTENTEFGEGRNHWEALEMGALLKEFMRVCYAHQY